jgi:hypothetical protein
MASYHLTIFLHAIRTGLVILAGILSYDILKDIEYIWNTTHPHEKTNNLVKSKLLSLLIVVVFDILILYTLRYMFGLKL